VHLRKVPQPATHILLEYIQFESISRIARPLSVKPSKTFFRGARICLTKTVRSRLNTLQLPMPAQPRPSAPWSCEDGWLALTSILKARIPQWPDGPHDWQVKATARVLHLLLHKALRETPSTLPYSAHTVDKPVVLVVTPLTDRVAGRRGRGYRAEGYNS